MTNEELLFEFARELRNGGLHEVASNRAIELRAELLRRLGAAVSASPQPRPWFPIETAPKNGRHIQAADFTPGKTGFGGNPQQSFQCVVHWWEWCDGTHQEEWGWYPSTGAGESDALTTLTHWKPLEEFFAAAPAHTEPDYNRAYVILGEALKLNPEYYGLVEMAQVAADRLTGKYDLSPVEPDEDYANGKPHPPVGYVLEPPAQEQPVENSPQESPKKRLMRAPTGEVHEYCSECVDMCSEYDHFSPQKGKP